MLTADILSKLKERYSQVHPLIFYRSIEKSKKDVDLFDILDTIPKGFPIIWCEENQRWTRVDDVFQSQEFFK
jgi:hypothetical protein